MKLIRIWSILLIFTIILSVFSSCKSYDNLTFESNTDDSSTIFTDENNTTSESSTVDDAITIFTQGGYTSKIIRSNSATTLEKSFCTKIKALFKKFTGVNPETKTDYTAEDAKKYDGPAIIIGETNYTESQDAYKELKNNQATATILGNKYVIAFSTKGSAEKLLISLEALLTENSTKDTIKINSNWNINVRDENYKMTKTEWLNQYKDIVSERDMALLSRSYDVLAENTLQDESMPWGDSPAISPWSGSTAGLWNWDSVFHAMTVCRYDAELAKSCIDSFAMFQKDNGLLPDVIYPNGKMEDNYSKPPVFAWGVLTVYEATGDIEFLRRNYERAVKNESFWRTYRFDNNLFYYSAQENPSKDDYLHPRWESGWDNSPRWDVTPIVDLYPIDLNCYMVLFYRSLAKMADILGESNAKWESREKALIKQIESKLYDENIGAYVDRNRKTGEYSTVLSPASFMPLFIGTASQERAESMNEIARNTNKFYPGMPSVSYDDQGYDNNYWRGPTWLNIAFFAVKGLDDYGFNNTSNEIKEFILNMCYDGLPYIY